MENSNTVIEEYVPTTQELINQKLSRMLDLDSFLASKDYLTDKSIDGNDMSAYGDFPAKRNAWRDEYNALESEVADLKLILESEQSNEKDI